jgi:uncharacterized protein YndB with AHSA1/START domain
MSAFEAEAVIAASPDDVWTTAADILRHPAWMNVADARVVRGVGTQVGDRGRERLRLGPLVWDIEFEVAEAEPGRRLRWRSIDDPHFDLEVVLSLDPAGTGSTRATYGAAVRTHGRWRLLAPLIAMEGSAGVRREVGRLRELIERPAATGA